MKNKHNYKSIYQEVKSTILDQTYPTNTLLPTETTLAEKIQCFKAHDCQGVQPTAKRRTGA